MKNRRINFLKLSIIIIGAILLLICTLWLPQLAASTAKMNPEYAYLKYPILISIYATTIPFYFSLYEALKLLNYVGNKRAFSQLAVNSLGYIKNCAIIIIILYLIGIFYLALHHILHPGIAIISLAIIFTTLTISLFIAILQELLKEALKIKSENDLTI